MALDTDQGSVGVLARPRIVPGSEEDEFPPLDLTVIEANFPVAKLQCDTDDGCGATCNGSACNSQAYSPA